MATEIGELVYKITGDSSSLNKQIKKSDKQVSTFSSTVKTLGVSLLAIFGAGKIISGVKSFVNNAAAFEQLNVSFTTFLGSAEKATEVLAELEQFSIVTPFTIDQVNQAGRSLLAFGIESEDLTDTLKAVGDVASATGKDFNDLATIYGKARTQGTLFAEDINQLTEAGIPIIKEFAEQLGVTEGEVKKLGSEGKISFSNLEQAFQDMTGEGGQFFDLMSKQSRTFSGRLSTLQGNLSLVARAIGERLLPIIGPFVDKINDLVTGADAGDIALRKYNNAISEVSENQVKLNNATGKTEKEISKLNLEVSKSKLKEAQIGLTSATIDLNEELIKQKDIIGELEKSNKNLDVEGIRKQINGYEKDIKDASEALIDLKNEQEKGILITRVDGDLIDISDAIADAEEKISDATFKSQLGNKTLADSELKLAQARAKKGEITAQIEQVEITSRENVDKKVDSNVKLIESNALVVESEVEKAGKLTEVEQDRFDAFTERKKSETELLIEEGLKLLEFENLSTDEKAELAKELTRLRKQLAKEEEETENEKNKKILAQTRSTGNSINNTLQATSDLAISLIDMGIKEEEKANETKKGFLIADAIASRGFAIFSNILNTQAAMAEIDSKWASNPTVAGVLKGIAIGESVARSVAIAAAPLPQFATGTANVPNDQVAQIHRGETIIPRTFAEDLRAGNIGITGGNNDSSSGNVIINIMSADGQTLDQIVRERTESGEMTIDSRALVTTE